MQQLIAATIKQYDFNLLYANALVADIDDIQMTITPAPGLSNHPAFTLGHLVTGSAMMAEDLGQPVSIPEGWMELFARKGPGDQTRPDLDIARYPSKTELLQELERTHNLVKDQLQRATETQLNKNVRWRFGNHMPTLADLTLFMCINHESMHLGQLAAWRRAMNLPAALNTL